MDAATIGMLGRDYAAARLNEAKCQRALDEANHLYTAASNRRSEAYDILTRAIIAHVEGNTNDSK